jgi:hypothetical protein
MKKAISIISLIFIAGAVLLPLASAQAVGPPSGCEIRRDLGIEDCSEGTCDFSGESVCGMCCLLQSIYNVTDWVFTVMVALAVLYVIWGAVKILTAGDSKEEVDKGRKFIMYAALGLLVGFLAKAVPQVVKMFSGL